MNWQEEFAEEFARINRQFEELRRRKQQKKRAVHWPTLPSDARRPQAWLTALGIPIGLGLAFSLIVLSVLHNWVSAAIPALLIYLSLTWR